MTEPNPSGLQCPLPIADYPRVLMAHGGGGRLMHELIEKMFVAALDNEHLAARHDSVVLHFNSGKLAFTTDSYVVQPLFFPGGDIGSLAVYGTVNDLAMAGARPRFLSCGLILEEGLATETLWRIVGSMAHTAKRCGVQLVTGDTKVVERGKGDGIFINTAGIGVIEHNFSIAPGSVRPGDAIILSGDIGRHGIAIMAAREGLAFESAIESDSASLWPPVQRLLSAGIEIHCLRDLTRGGLASALIEIAEASGQQLAIEEGVIPVRRDVGAACEILGLDPLYVANEGRLVAFLPPGQAEEALRKLRAGDPDSDAALIGKTMAGRAGRVVLRTRMGTERVIDMLSGEQLPRIC